MAEKALEALVDVHPKMASVVRAVMKMNTCYKAFPDDSPKKQVYEHLQSAAADADVCSLTCRVFKTLLRLLCVVSFFLILTRLCCLFHSSVALSERADRHGHSVQLLAA